MKQFIRLFREWDGELGGGELYAAAELAFAKRKPIFENGHYLLTTKSASGADPRTILLHGDIFQYVLMHRAALHVIYSLEITKEQYEFGVTEKFPYIDIVK